jgi:type II secretory pathway component PulF
MAVFEYKAMDMDTSLVAGTIVADSPRQARDMLRDRGLTVTRVHATAEQAGPSLGARRQGRRSQVEVTGLVRELATLLTVGIPLLAALQTLSRQHRGNFRTVVQHLADQVAEGVALAEAMARQPLYFDTLCVSIVRVGENTGSLETSLKRLAQFRDKAQGLRNRVLTALVYPAAVCVIGLAASIFLMTYVVPSLLGALVQAGRTLPAMTQAVKAASDFLLDYWWALLAGVAALVVAAKAVLRTERGRRTADRIKLRIPVFGDLARKECTSRIAVVMAALLRSGLQFVDALHITRGTIRNCVFQQAIDEYEAAVSAGSDVAGPLESSGVFPPMVVHMLAVGQQSGELEEMLEQLAEAYDQEVALATRRLTALMEPLLIVLLAVLIGFIAIATLLPILEASNVL